MNNPSPLFFVCQAFDLMDYLRLRKVIDRLLVNNQLTTKESNDLLKCINAREVAIKFIATMEKKFS